MYFTPEKEMVQTRKNQDGAGVSRKDAMRDTSHNSQKSTSSSLLARKKQLELQAAEAKARIEIDLVEKRLEANLAELQEEYNSQRGSNDKRSNGSNIEQWMEQGDQELKAHTAQEQGQPGPITSHEKGGTTVHLLAKALNDLTASAHNGPDSSLLSRISTPRDLPSFAGDCMEWLQFKQAYEESTEVCKFTPKENLWRLRKCLHGAAKDCVAALLISASSPETVMDTLQLQFGNPDNIITKIMQDIRKMHSMSQDYHKEIVSFSVKVQNYVAAVQALGKQEYLQGMNVATIILGKMPAILISKWVDYSHPLIASGKPTLEILSTFLYEEAKKVSLSSVHLINYKPDYYNYKRRDNFNVNKPQVLLQSELQQNTNKSKVLVQSELNKICKFCHLGKHVLLDCKLFKRSLRKNRWLFVKRYGICYQCLMSHHKRDTCTAPMCEVEGCGLPHHHLLHYNFTKHPLENNANDDETLQSSQNGEIVSNVNSNTYNVLLKIVPIKIYGHNGKIINTTALLDDGSTVSLINNKLANDLGLSGSQRCIKVSGAWQNSEINCIANIVNINLANKCGEMFQCQMLSVEGLNIPIQNIPMVNCKFYKHLYEIKNEFNLGLSKPQVLIGQDNYHLIMPLETKLGKPNEPCATLTPLGWCIHGRVQLNSPTSHKLGVNMLNCNQTTLFCKDTSCEDNNHILQDIHDLVKSSFSLDAIGISAKQRQNPDDLYAQTQLDQTARLFEGRWEVGLPWKNRNSIMPDTFPTALKRLKYVEKKIMFNEEYGERYKGRITHLFQNNYAHEVTVPDTPLPTWYLPHFGVDNPNKKKLRLVFDAAARSNGLSLNDFLLKGPDLLASLLGIMFRFRIHKVAVTADIKDMFLRIKIRSEDQSALRFLWRDSPSEPVNIYAMSSLIFGANCSPFIAQYVKNKNAKQYESTMPSAVSAICQQHFMDDYIDSLPNEKMAIELTKQIIFIHQQGGFNICNWTSNSETVLNNLPKNIISSSAVNLTIDKEHTSERTLGLLWYPGDDTLRFDLSFKKISHDIISGKQRPTKREMLQIIMSVFDVYGFLSPFTINGKIMLQDTWRSKINWDDYITDEVNQKWRNWLKQLKVISNISLPRCYQSASSTCQQVILGNLSHGNQTSIHSSQFNKTLDCNKSDIIYSNLELHVFCDASTKAMCAVAYWRWFYNDQIMVAFVASKSRVAPLKSVTVPRLELQAALLGARLAKTIIEDHKLTPCRRVFWCDSTTVLHWINNNTRSYKTYEANRLAEIDEITKSCEWRYIPTGVNVADIATRENYDCTSLQKEWFSGPQFLYMNEVDWPQCTIKFDKDQDELQLVNIIQNLPKNADLPVPEVTRFSQWLRLLRSTAAVFKFINKCRKLIVDESTILKNAERMLILKSQQDTFWEEIIMLKNNKNIDKKSRILTLSPYLDEDGLLRVGGRIDAARNVNFEMKRPVILDGKNYLAKLIVKHYHVSSLHGNQETVVNELKQRYWIVKIRPTVKEIASKCMFCRIRKAKPVPPRMGDLPEARVAHHQRPFTFCGLDLFGPMEVTVTRHREKRYGVLFTCLTVRAIHIEIVNTLTSDSLIMALRRMAARRGWPLNLYSDNGTNLRGADAELKLSIQALDIEKLKGEALNKGTTWNFIPPASPHWGGAWERLIRSVKVSLKVILQERAPKEETLITLLTEVENIVNSRPLTHVSVDPCSIESLTPNHFLLGSSNNLPRLGVFDESEIYLKKQWRIAQWLADMFWKRWTREVLPDMLPRRKWTSDEAPPLKIGDLVFVVDPDAPRNVWPRGVIENVVSGKDGRVRMVIVKTKSGILKRSAIRVARIPVES